MSDLYIIKIGGHVIDREEALSEFLAQLSRIEGKKILVHGGGKTASAISEKLGILPQVIEGRRITDAETLKVATMVYAGWINKNIVSKLQGLRCNAIGICGADGMAITATKRKSSKIDYGFVGDITEASIHSQFFCELLEREFLPVVSPITADAGGQLLNTNADTIAATLSAALAKKFRVHLLYCFEKNGVLENPEDENTVIPKLTPAVFAQFKEQGIISGGMIPKLENAIGAIEKGVTIVKLIHFSRLEKSIQLNTYEGTEISY